MNISGSVRSMRCEEIYTDALKEQVTLVCVILSRSHAFFQVATVEIHLKFERHE